MNIEAKRGLRFALSTVSTFIVLFSVLIPITDDAPIFLYWLYFILIYIVFSFIFSFIFKIKKSPPTPFNNQKIKYSDLLTILITLLLTTIFWVLLNINFLPKYSSMGGMITDPVISILYLCLALGASIFIVSMFKKVKK